MCDSCGYVPSVHRTVHHIIVFEDHDELGNPVLGVHSETGSMGDEGFRAFPGREYVRAGVRLSDIAEFLVSHGSRKIVEQSGISRDVAKAIEYFFDPEDTN